jgi:uncharacterized protein YndB with AHSA1/START domain
MTTEVIARNAAHGEAIEPGAIRFVRLLPGPIERVWAFLTESDKRERWLASGAMEARVGADFSLTFRHRHLSPDPQPTPERFKKYDAGHTSHHRITRFEPPHLLAFTWGSGGEEPSEVTFELSEQGSEVRLVLTHRRIVARDVLLGVSRGWHAHLAVLVERLNGRELPSFWQLFDSLEGDYAKRLSDG